MLSTISAFLPYHFSFNFTEDEKQNHCEFDNLQSLSDLSQFLTAEEIAISQWMNWKKEIKAFVQNYADQKDDLDEFLKEITAWGLKKDPQATMAFVTEIISLDMLIAVVRHKERFSALPFKNVAEWAVEHADLCPEQTEEKLESHIESEWRRYRPVVIYFIPNMINIFLGAFNFLDIRKKYTTLWEKHLLLEIIYKFFIVPYFIYKLLQPFIEVTAKVYLATAMVIAATGLLVSIYQRWLRPPPDEIVNCINLDKLMERGVIEPKVGQTKEIEKLIAALEVDANVVLIGDSGVGKTALVHHLVALKHAKKVPDKVQKLNMYEVDCGLMLSSVSFGYSELISQIKDQCEGYEDKILLFFDEFFQIASNKDAFRTFKKRFLEDAPQSRFVATMTSREFLEIIKHDIDGSFRRRVVPIIVESGSEDSIRLILQEFVQRKAQDIVVTDEAITAAIELSCVKDYMPEIGSPAKGIKLVTDAIGICRAAFDPSIKTEELNEALQDYQGLTLQAMREVKISSDVLLELRRKREKISVLEKELQELKGKAKKIKKWIGHQKTLHGIYYNMTHQLAATATQELIKEDEDEILDDEKKNIAFKIAPAISEEAQATYLWTYFYAAEAMKKLINEQIEKVRPHLPIQVDADLIRQVYETSKKIDKTLSKANQNPDDDKKAEPLQKEEAIQSAAPEEINDEGDLYAN